MPAELLETEEVVVLAEAPEVVAIMGQVGFGIPVLLAIMATSPAHPPVAPEAQDRAVPAAAPQRHRLKAGAAVVAPAPTVTAARVLAARVERVAAVVAALAVQVCRLETHHPAARQIPHALAAEVVAGPEKTYPGQTPEQVAQAEEVGVM